MAGSWGLRDSRGVLSSRNSSGSTVGVPGAFEGQGSLDWFINRRSGAECSACYYYKFIRLAKRGSVF